CSSASTRTHSDSIAAGNCAGNYVITRTWSSTDGCGNSGSATQTITVQDTLGPVGTPSAHKSICCPDSTDPTVNLTLGTATALDNCSGASTPTHSDSIAAGNCAGNYVI